jgi:hypothetical protein
VRTLRVSAHVRRRRTVIRQFPETEINGEKRKQTEKKPFYSDNRRKTSKPAEKSFMKIAGLV